jgi:hypothetical protein
MSEIISSGAYNLIARIPTGPHHSIALTCSGPVKDRRGDRLHKVAGKDGTGAPAMFFRNRPTAQKSTHTPGGPFHYWQRHY